MQLLKLLKDMFSLEEDKANEEEIVESIKKGVEFKGTNLWALMFSIFIASIGLNVNSAAVIIGAMLISPLMGPIMGFGLGIGINDFELIKKSAKNLVVAILISMIVSTCYFLITPLKGAQSELLARTTPAIWDVFIAFFGGLAGIVAGSRKDKGNAIPGVAIATALMPPLCTASYGIATGNITYFAGAFYLFFINSVFISFSTFLIVRLLKFRKKQFLDKERENQVKKYIAIIIILTLLPSSYLGKLMVDKVYFESKAEKFIKNEIASNGIQIVENKILFKDKKIEIYYIGENLSDIEITVIKNSMKNYKLSDTKLEFKQVFDLEKGLAKNIQTMKQAVLEEFYNKNSIVIAEKNKEIAELKGKIEKMSIEQKLPLQIKNEINVIYPELKNVRFFIGEDKAILIYEKEKKLSFENEERIKKIIEVKSGIKINEITLIYQK